MGSGVYLGRASARCKWPISCETKSVRGDGVMLTGSPLGNVNTESMNNKAVDTKRERERKFFFFWDTRKNLFAPKRN